MFLKDLVSSIDTKGVDVSTRTFKGKLIDTLEKVCNALDIDLMLIEPRTNSIKDEVYLGKTSGRIVKRTQIPILIVPEDYVYKPIVKILIALKSAIIKKEGVLNPLKSIKNKFKAVANVLLVRTPYHKEGDFVLNDELKAMLTNITYAESPTTFQAVLEHYKNHSPDLLCVVRRKRGFFSKLWEDNTILKKDFHSSKIPVLVLSEMK
jgi:hypothetical protein